MGEVCIIREPTVQLVNRIIMIDGNQLLDVLPDGPVLEHAVYQFSITGISLSLVHELLRHRAGFSFMETS